MRRSRVVFATLCCVLLALATQLPTTSAREEAMWRFPNYSAEDSEPSSSPASPLPSVIPAAPLTDDSDASNLDRFESARADTSKPNLKPVTNRPRTSSKTRSPSRGCNAQADPCYDPTMPARATIVSHVSSANGRFVSPYSQSEQSGYQPVDTPAQAAAKAANKGKNGGKKQKQKQKRPKLPSVKNVDENDLQQLLKQEEAKDPATVELQNQVVGLLKKIQADKKWLSAVHAIVTHYKAKAAAVEAGLRNEAQGVKTLQVAMRRRHQENIRKALQKKLSESQKQLEMVEQNAGAYTDKRQQVNELKTRLIHNINQIRRSMRHVSSF